MNVRQLKLVQIKMDGLNVLTVAVSVKIPGVVFVWRKSND